MRSPSGRLQAVQLTLRLYCWREHVAAPSPRPPPHPTRAATRRPATPLAAQGAQTSPAQKPTDALPGHGAAYRTDCCRGACCMPSGVSSRRPDLNTDPKGSLRAAATALVGALGRGNPASLVAAASGGHATAAQRRAHLQVRVCVAGGGCFLINQIIHIVANINTPFAAPVTPNPSRGPAQASSHCKGAPSSTPPVGCMLGSGQ